MQGHTPEILGECPRRVTTVRLAWSYTVRSIQTKTRQNTKFKKEKSKEEMQAGQRTGDRTGWGQNSS